MLVPLEDLSGTGRAAQPARHDRRASELAPPPRAAGARAVRGARRAQPRRRHPPPSPMTPHDSARHAAPAIPSRLHLRRCRGPGALLRAARHQPSLCLADRHGAAGLAARLRRDRRHARQSRAGRRGGVARPVVGARRGGLGADPRHRAQPHGGRCGQRLVGRRAAPRPRQPLRPLLRHRLGGGRQDPAADPRPPARRGRWRRASSSATAMPSATSPIACPPSTAAWRTSTGGWPGGAAPAIASTGGASSTSTSWSACAWRSPRPSRPSMPCRSACTPRASSTACASIMSMASAIPPPIAGRCARGSKPGAWLVVEKILLAGESLPADWGCDGTTGYDFMDEVNALQHDAAGERVLAEAWSALSGRPADFAAEEEPARREILARSFGAQLDACAASFAGGELSTAAAAPRAERAAGAFPGLSHLRPRRRALGRRSRRARPRRRRRAPHVPRDRPLGDRSRAAPVRRARPRPRPSRASSSSARRSPPRRSRTPASIATAACCRATMSASIPPPSPSTPTPSIAACSARRADWPRALLATATHDHKRGEDVRARLAVLSGMAAEWAALQRDWVEASRPLARPMSDGKRAPGPGDVALLLQTIVGAWPFDLEAGDLRAGAPSPSGWSPGSRRRCARPSSPATGPPSTRPTRRRRATSPSRWSPTRRCPTCCTASPPWCSASPRPARSMAWRSACCA